MAEYQSARDEHVLPFYEFTTQIAALEPPTPELAQVLGAVHGNQEAMDGFVRVAAGVTSPAEFFSEENVGRLLAFATQACPESAVRGDTTNSSEQIGRHLVWSSQLRLGALRVTGARGMSWPREPVSARAQFPHKDLPATCSVAIADIEREGAI